MTVHLAPGQSITVGMYRYQNYGDEAQTIHIGEKSDSLSGNVQRCHAAEYEAEERMERRRREEY